MKIKPKAPSEMLVGAEYLEKNGKIYAYIKVAERTSASVNYGGRTLPSISNQAEPYDFKLHIFEFDKSELEREPCFSVCLAGRRKNSAFFSDTADNIVLSVTYSPSKCFDLESSRFRSDRGLKYSETSDSEKCGGLEWHRKIYLTPDDKTVRVYIMTVDLKKCDILAGTPYGKTEFCEGEIQTVMDEAREAEKRGRRVLGATNADFFDMFGDCRPSGLCISGGKTVSAPQNDRLFFGITKDGAPVIASPSEIPPEDLLEAVGGKDLIVNDGKVFDVAPLEGFGELTHPRTAVGIRADGRVLIAVVDGRRPAWSNGASLAELAKLMTEHGAVRALNLDGGGSSTFIVRKGGELSMLNHPADLARPDEDLIRPVYNTLIVTEKWLKKGRDNSENV